MPTPHIRSGARLLAVGAAILALAVGAWLFRREPPGPEPRPAGGAGPRSDAAGPATPVGGPPAPPASPPAQASPAQVVARLDRGDRDLSASYAALGAASVPSGLLTLERVILLAGFPDESRARYGAVLRDPAAELPLKLAALDALGVLARSGDRDVEALYREVLERAGEHPPVLEWAAVFLGRYYDGGTVQAALLRRALDGSPAAVEALSTSAASDLSGLRPAGERHAAALRRATERVALLRAADARLRLREILQGPEDGETLDWAIRSVARAGYAEAADDIRRVLPRLGKKIVPEDPEAWEYWEAKGRDPQVAQAVEALSRLRNLSPMEERLVRHYVLDGRRASALAALEARRDDPQFRDLRALFGF